MATTPTPEFSPDIPASQGLPGQEFGTPSTAPAAPVTGRKHWYFGLGGLLAGLAVGLLVATVGGAAGGALGQSNAIPKAVEACSATEVVSVEVLDDGASLTLATAGEESEGANMTTVVCVLGELEAPDSLFSRMDSTRAMDGTQNATWGNFTASWNYHPDNGLNVIVETAAR